MSYHDAQQAAKVTYDHLADAAGNLMDLADPEWNAELVGHLKPGQLEALQQALLQINEALRLIEHEAGIAN